MNHGSLLDTCSTHFGSVASSSISHRIDPPDRLPVILIIARHRGNNDVVEIIEGLMFDVYSLYAVGFILFSFFLIY